MSLRKDILDLASQLIPTRTRIVVRGSQQPAAVAHTLSVDTLHGYLRSAEQGDTADLFALYRDIIGSHAHTQAEFGKRKLAVLREPFSLTPADPEDDAQAAHTKAVLNHLADRTDWLRSMSHLLDSSLFPISLLERWYKPSAKPGWRYEIDGIKAVPNTHLSWPDGVISLRDTDPTGQFTGTYTQPDPRLYITHQGNLLTAVPDWWGGPARAIVFWWLFATMGRDWWARFMDRFGSPFLEGSYSSNDDRSRWELENAFSAATRLFGIVVSNETQVKVHQVNTQQGGDAFESFHAVANREISKLIVGQTLSAEGQNLGLGGGQAGVQSDVRDDIRQFDALCLAQTVRTQILAPLWRLNGWTLPMPHVSFGALSTEDAEVNGELLATLFQAGIEPTDEALKTISRRLGFGLQRTAPVSPGTPVPLSSPAPKNITLLPTVSRRAARQRQARGAVDALVQRSTPKLARLMANRAEDLQAAILASDSPEDAASRIAALTASFDPSEAGELIEHVLTSAAVNAVIAS